jgi:uncharacterized protein YjiK
MRRTGVTVAARVARACGAVVVVLAALLGGMAGPLAPPASASPLTGIDLGNYVRVGRFDLPEPTRSPAPPNSLLAQEASSVTYDWDTDTLFVVGDGGTSIVQVTKTGQLIDSMTLAPGGSPQGTTFYDTEGLTYIGGGQFVMTEERDRQIVKFTYAAGTTLTRAQTQTVKLGTTIGNVGLEGVANDPYSSGFVLVKEKQPESIFQTSVDWSAGTASNGSPTTDESSNMFDPALLGVNDLSDVYSLSNLSTLTGPETSHLLVISQESGKILNVDRSGNVSSSLTIEEDASDTLSVVDMTMEGVTVDNDGTVYVVNENGGGDVNHPQLWVYKPTNAPDQPPTGVVLHNVVSSIPENTNTQGGIPVADIVVLDDGLGVNNLSLSGPDASAFTISGTTLEIASGTSLDYETKSTYNVTINVDDPTVGATPDTSTSYTLHVSDVVNENAPAGTVRITEVAPWSSGNSPVAQDWFELTNMGGTPVDLTGWKMDDNSYSFGSAVALRGPWNGTGADPIGSLAPGESRIFIESGSTPTAADATLASRFSQVWFSGSPPAGLKIDFYGGSGVGLSTGGDAVNIYNSGGAQQAGVSFGTSTAPPTLRTFDNSLGTVDGPGTTVNPAPAITTLSTVGTNHAFNAAHPTAGSTEAGSPGADNLAPTFANLPLDSTTEATGSTTSVPYSAPSATDLRDGSVAVSCTPASPGPFPVGTTTVNCSAADAAGNTATTSFHVTVADTQPPTINVPSNIQAVATGALTPVSFGPVTANDAVDGVTTATCSPASPGPFPLGTTHVDCFTTDTHGNRGSAPFNVTVQALPDVDISASPVVVGSTATIGVDIVDPTATGIPTGTVDLVVDGTDRGALTLDSTGHAAFSVPGLTVGVHSLHATYLGDALYLTNTGDGTVPVNYAFTGFAQPVDNNGVLNLAKAGQAIALKWRLTDAHGSPVTNLDQGAVTVTATSLTCAAGTTVDAIEEYATGDTGLQNLGNGYYQWNWKTPKTYAMSCKTLHVNVGDSLTHNALFQFTK